MCERYMRRGISLFLSVLLCFAAGLTGTAVEEDGAAGILYDLSFDTEDPPRALIDFGRTGDQYMRGQGFVAVEGGDLTSVDVHIARMGSPSTLIAQLYACDDMGLPQGEPIAQTTLPADTVPADTAGVVSIPLAYEGLEAGGRYMVALGQETANYDNDYRWTVSCDASNPDWWQDWVTNPQVQQAGFAGDLPSLKFEEGGGVVDESRCGDLWMQVHYTADKPAAEPLPLGKEWQTLYEQDMAAGGLSFYMDRLLARPGVDPSLSSDSGLMTRGRALYTKGTNDSGLMTEFGFGGVMRYVKGDQPGYTLQINGQRAADFQESTARRVDYPSYWTSRYTGTAGTDSEGLQVTLRRFITDYNVAVTVLDITNATDEDKTVEVSLQPPASCDTLEGDTYTGGIWVDYRNIDLRVSLDGGRAAAGELVSTLTLAAGKRRRKRPRWASSTPRSRRPWPNMKPTRLWTARRPLPNMCRPTTPGGGRTSPIWRSPTPPYRR